MEIKEILQSIGYSNISEDTKNFRMKPIYRDSSSNTVLSVRKDTGSFIDFSRNLSGSFNQLIKLSLNFKTEQEALEWIGKNVDGGINLNHKEQKPTIKEPKIFSKVCLEKVIADHSYWINRGVSQKTLELFNGGIVKVGKMKDRYIFPIYDYKKNLIGVSGRDMINDPNSKRPKWKHIGDKSQWKYPMQLNNKLLRKKREAIVVESIGDMLALWDAGIQNTVVTFGLQISVSLINYFLRIDAQKIYLSFNNDEGENSAGNQAAKKNHNRLLRYFDPEQIAVALPFKGDFGDMSREQIFEWQSSLI